MIHRNPDESILRYCLADLFGVAKDKFGLEPEDLTADEIFNTVRGFENGMSEYWCDIMREALVNAFEESRRKV